MAINKLIKKHINLSELSELKTTLRQASLHTVCEEALCPNIGECFTKGTATFLIAGKACTRNCTFCAVEKGIPQALDLDEPARIAQTVKKLKLKYVVLTSVTRDDLYDGGAGHFAKTIKAVRELNQSIKIEVLVPDFSGNKLSAMTVFNAKPFVFNHNIETVPGLYEKVRPKADYFKSLKLIGWAKAHGLATKSGMMLGMGESEKEVIAVMKDLIKNGCDMLTLGQYLPPSKYHYPLKNNISEETFEKYKETALDLGFKKCQSSAYVRSSYMAEAASAASMQ